MAINQQQLANITSQAEALKGKVGTLSQAQDAGFSVTPQATVQEAQNFLRGRNVSVPGQNNVPAVVSSDSVLQNRDTGESVNSAANALTAGTAATGNDGLTSMFNPATDVSGLQANVMNTAVENQIGRTGDAFSALDAIDASFDARLGRINQQYKNQMQDLKSSFESQKQMATQQAAALNPYSNAQGAMTARNFTGAIENKYQEQAQRMTEAAQIAQNELEAGRYEAYTNIQNAMEESNRQFKAGMAQFMLDAQNQYNTAQQQEREFGLDVARFGLQQDQFGLQQQEFGENRFMDFVNQFSQDPTFKQNLNMFYETGEINEGLMPLIERGMAAGLSPNETLALSQYETADQRQSRIQQEQFQQQMGVQWYNAETNRMNAVRQLNDAAAKAQNEQDTVLSKINSRSNIIKSKGEEALQKLAQGGMLQTGILGQLTSGISSSPAGDLEQVYTTLKGAVAFDELAQMRAESPTGGALGQVSNMEVGLLAGSEGVLDAGLQRDTQVKNVTGLIAAAINTETAIRLDQEVSIGQKTQEQAITEMQESLITGDDVLADFNAMQTQAQTSAQTGVSTNAQSSPAVGNYLNELGY